MIETEQSVRLLLSLLLALTTADWAQTQETAYNAEFCVSVGGETETRHYYDYPAGRSYVQADCETGDMVYEGGLDKRSSLDSIQQALFLAYLTGKEPAVVIYDTDEKVGPYEHRIRIACELIGVRFLRLTQSETE